MLKILLTIGCSGSGKSTFAKNLIESDSSWVEINRDIIRANIFLQGDQHQMWQRYKHTKANEKLVNQQVEIIFHNSVRDKKNIIISDTNLNIKTRQYWVDIAYKYNYLYEEKIFGLDLTVDDLLKRDFQRTDKPVGKDVILNQWSQFYRQFGRKYIPNNKLPKAILVDIDGTIAKKSPLRGYFNWDLVGLDSPRQFVVEIIQFLSKIKKYHIIFLSGRDSQCEDITKNWLLDNLKITERDFSLYMRQHEDSRNDRTIKEELFFSNVANNYNVIAVIDDRPRVIRLWKDIGIENVIDVSNTYLEF
jgi:predicted kinase